MQRIRPSKERFDLENLKGRKFLFGVHVTSTIGRSASVSFESCILCSSGKYIETFILQGFNYTPIKVMSFG